MFHKLDDFDTKKYLLIQDISNPECSNYLSYRLRRILGNVQLVINPTKTFLKTDGD